MALKRIQKVSGCQVWPGCPREIPRNLGCTAWEGRGHWGGRGPDRSARTGEACIRRVRVLGTRGDPIRSCPFQAEPRIAGAGARGVARLSRGVCIPAGQGFALQRGGLRPRSRRASSQCPQSPSSCVLTPGSPGGQGRCGGPKAFILRAWGWVFLGSAVGWCSVGGKGWESEIGAEEPAESSLAPAILVVLHAAATSGHIAVHIVADT